MHTPSSKVLPIYIYIVTDKSRSNCTISTTIQRKWLF